MITDLVLEPEPEPEPVLVDLGPLRSHFGQCARGWGVQSVPGDVLAYALGQVVHRSEEAFVTRLRCTLEGHTVYSFRVAEGCFYAILSPRGRTITS